MERVYWTGSINRLTDKALARFARAVFACRAEVTGAHALLTATDIIEKRRGTGWFIVGLPAAPVPVDKTLFERISGCVLTPPSKAAVQ